MISLRIPLIKNGTWRKYFYFYSWHEKIENMFSFADFWSLCHLCSKLVDLFNPSVKNVCLDVMNVLATMENRLHVFNHQEVLSFLRVCIWIVQFYQFFQKCLYFHDLGTSIISEHSILLGQFYFRSTCEGPKCDLYRKWKQNGMFDLEATNGKGWKGTNWPPK